MAKYNEALYRAGLSLYLLIYEIDLDRDWIHLVYETEEQGSFGMAKEMVYSEFLAKYIVERVDLDFQEQQKTFGDPDYLRENLPKEKVIKSSYTANYGKWRQTEWRIGEMKGGELKSVFFCFRRVDDDRAATFRLRQENERGRILLEMALKEANAANQAKTTFLENVSHDIRTPMNAVMGYTTLALTKVEKGSEIEEYLNNIMSASRELVAMMDNLLDVTRIESGREHIVESEESLQSIVGELRTTFLQVAREEHQKFRVSMETPDRLILCDRGHLLQVLMILLNNSHKYSEKGTEILLTVREQTTPLSSYVTIEFLVEDHGIGMDEAFARKAFEPFSRERTSKESGIPGSGLGLPIAKQLVEMMGGKIYFTSEKGKGTLFHVLLDLKLSPDDPIRMEEEDRKGSLRDQENAIPGIFAGHRFLIVDDEPSILDQMNRILRKYGAEVEAAGSGVVGTEMVKRSNPFYYNAVIMDIKMTGLDGYGAAKRIRNLGNPDLAGVPILAIGVEPYHLDREKMKNVSIDAYVTKPLKESELVRKLQEISL